jgi:hypothetical protein
MRRINAFRLVGYTLGAVGLVLVVGCGKKKKGDGGDEATPTTVQGSGGSGASSGVASVDGATVSALTSQLQLGSSITIIPAKEDGAALALQGTDLDAAIADVHYRVDERSLDQLEQAGGIMCFLGQARPWEQANLGPYVALVNEDDCFENEEEGGDSSSSSASASATTAVNYRRVVVEATRAENAPLVAKFWIDGDEYSPDGIKAHLSVAEGPSDANPLGIFRLQFAEEGGSGAIDTARDAAGAVVLQFAESSTSKEYSGQSAIAATLDIAGNEVVGGRFRGVFNFADSRGRGEAGDMAVAFNSTHLLRSGTVRREDFSACLARDKYEMHAHGYSLFDSDDGSTVDLESGFPIEVNVGGQVYFGHAGYHGLWLPNEIDRSDVETVTRVEYQNGVRNETNYNVLQAPGKLTKYTAQTVTLGELKGVELRQHAQGSANLVVWDGSSFQITGTMTFAEGSGPTVEEASGDADPMCFGGGGGGGQQCFYQFYVESLSANIRIPAGEESDDYEVRYHERMVVSGSDDVPSEDLVCFERCLLMDPTAEQFAEQAYGFQAAGPFKATTVMGQEVIQTLDLTTPLETYTWNALTHNLVNAAGDAFVAPSVSSGQQIWHSTGMLIPQSAYESFSNPADMNPWGLEGVVDEFYRFETGTSEWSRFMALTNDDGEIVQFDRPISISYSHSQANDLTGAEDSDYYGKPYQLNYGGPGQLHGIPSEPQDMGPWIPHFSLAVGADLGDYVAVPREVIQIMSPQDASVCAGLDPSLAPPVPAPGFVGAMPDIGTEPAGDLAVRYVGGQPAE